MSYLLLGILVFYLSFVMGRRALSFFTVPFALSEFVFLGTGLGLIILGYAVLFLGFVGHLNILSTVALLIFMGVNAAFSLRVDLNLFRESLHRMRGSLTPFHVLIFGLTGITLIAALAGVLAPETENDALCYHLHLSKIYAQTGKIGPLPHEINSVFPFLVEMFYTFSLVLGSVTLAKFFHFAMGLLAAGMIFTLVRRQVSNACGWTGTCLFITTPAVVNQFTTTNIDVGLAYFTILAVYACLRWLETSNFSWLILSGIFSGAILSSKYLGLISVLGIGCLILWKILQKGQSSRSSWQSLAFYCGAALIFSFYWYLRSYLHTGNPVFPYFYSVFKAGEPSIHYDDIGLSKNLVNFMTILWALTMRPDKFEGLGVQIGPGYLAFLPTALLALRTNLFTRFLIFLSLFFLLGWFLLAQSLRFFIPVLPLLAALVALGMNSLPYQGMPGRMIRGFFIFTLFLHAAFALYHYRHDYKVAAGLESWDAYLTRFERSYPPAQFINRYLDPNSKILAADETHLFYFDRAIFREVSYPIPYANQHWQPTLRQALQRLANDGVTHILETETPRKPGSKDRKLKGLRRLISTEQNDVEELLDLVYSKQVAVQDDPIRYRLYEIRKDRF